MKNTINLGSFLSLKAPNYLVDTVQEAIECEEKVFMIYTGSPQTTLRVPLEKLQIPQFQEICKQNQINTKNLIVHAPYIINPASSVSYIMNTTSVFLISELKRTYAIGIDKMVLHPGNATNGLTKQAAIQNTINMINLINESNPGVIICLETMAGKGTEIGSTFTELKEIINGVEKKHLVAVCLDTCHIFDAGYDLFNTNQLLDEFDKEIGLELLKVIHLNDSCNERGSHKDRHANLGYGKIG
jgi:deoxyribonuclease-4